MTAVALGAFELSQFLIANHITGEILHLAVPTPTVEAAARAVNAAPEQIIKSILFIVDGHPVLAVACGTMNIGRGPIADLYGVGRKRVKLATPAQVLDISGYEVGAMPPFGHQQPLPTVIDHRVLDLAEAYAGGGAENALLRLDPREIARLTAARVMDLLD